MGCNCGSKTKKEKFVYKAPQGWVRTYNTEVEARAAQIRNGGGHYTRQAA